MRVTCQVMRDFVCSDAAHLHRACAVTTTTRRDARQKKAKRCAMIIIPGKSIAAARTAVFAILGSVFEERRFNDAHQNYTWGLSRPAIEALGPLKLRLVSRDPIFIKGQH